jgi:uncharacterized protein YjbK
MPDAIETELKLALPDEAAYRRLLARVLRPGVEPPAVLMQANEFLDTADDVLRRHRCALRLRDEDGRWELALKGPALATVDPALTARIEEQCALDAAAAAAIREGARSPLESLRAVHTASELVRRACELVAARPLSIRGRFTNERLRLEPAHLAEPWDLCLELDRTTFPGGRVDHELEVELDDPSRATRVLGALRTLFRETGIAWTPARSKAERLFRMIDGLEGGAGGSDSV